MSANNSPSTPQDPASKDMPEPAGISGLFQATLQTVRGRFGGASETLASVQSSISTNPANPFLKFSGSTSIDLGKNELNKILDEYARQPAQNNNIKDKDKMRKSMIKLFNKPIDNRSPDETTYFQSVRTSADAKTYPEAETVFKEILSGETPKAHPNGISSLAFAFISILSLSLNRSDSNQVSLNRNSTSPYFDLSPLYGSNDGETDTVRTKDGSGMLWPDCFFEDRLATLPDAALALLILWNRFHNHTAKYLLWYNEKDKNGNDKWKDPLKFEEESQELLPQDNQIFNIARSITCINFINIVKEDILKGLFGLPFVGPSVEVDILHDVRGLSGSTKKGNCSTMESYFLYDFTLFMPPSIVNNPSDTASVLQQRNCMGLKRNENNYFDDGDLADVLFKAIETSACAPGARSISKQDGERVIRKIKQGQQWNVCTLNEFRESLGLKRLKSFSEWNQNPAVAGEAEKLYEKIDNLELYPGLLAEEPTADSGFCFGRTMTWGLITDIVTRTRSDPRFTAEFKEEELTKWGYNDCATIFSQGPFNAVMSKLLYRTLPHNFPYRSVYSLYPFTVPTPKSQARIKARIKAADAKHDLDFSRPKKKVKVLCTIEAISKVFNDPARFPSPYNQTFCELTRGYGNVLCFDGLALHDRDLMLTLFALLPDEGAAKRIGATFGEKAQEYLRDRCTWLRDKRAMIDIVEDVIDATCISWVCETIYDQDLYPNQKDKKSLDEEGTKKYRKEKEMDAREDFAACYAYIFRNGEPEIGLKVRERALNASKMLEDHLEKKLRELKRDDGDGRHFGKYLLNFFWWLKEFMGQLLQEYSATGKILPQTSAQTFLDRMMKAADLKPLKNVVDGTPHLLELKKKYQHGDTKRSEQEARELLEKNRVIANVIALSVVISVHFARVCAQAVDFYLDAKYASERSELVKLCTDKDSSNEKIMEYIREAQRIGQKFGLWRDVSLPNTEPQVIIQQGHGHPNVIIQQGDRVFADFSFAHNDSEQFEEPDKVKPGREIISLQGLGLHKCPVGAFIDETMAEMFRVIFSQRNLARASVNGQLRTTTLHPNPAPWDLEVFFDDVDGYSFCPKKLMLEFDADENFKKSGKRWEFTDDSVFFYLNWSLTAIKIVIVLIVIIRYIIMPTIPGFITSLSSYQALHPEQLDPECRNMTEIVPYTINSFRPKWFGLFGEPTIVYRTPIGRRAHKVTIVAIDKRDIQMRFWVDEKHLGTVLTELDSNVDCGEDVAKCLDLGFSAALIDIPSGRHTFKAGLIQQENETFSWGDRPRRVKMKVDQCL